MAETSKRYDRDFSQPRPAPHLRDPRLTTGDIIFLLQRETWDGIVTKPNGAIAASMAVLAATSRIGLTAARNILLEDWVAGRVCVPTLTAERMPIILPIAVEVVKRSIALRPPNAGPWLFVTGDGNQFPMAHVYEMFKGLGRQCGIPGSHVLRRCLQFFDRCFDGEGNDRAAVVALSGWLSCVVDSELTKKEIAEAASDRGRLREVLENNHPLAGAAGQFLGPKGMELAEDTRTIFRSQDRVPKTFSPVVQTDPACILLRRISWPGKGKMLLRRKMKAAYFDHLDDLRKAGLIRTSEIAYLFSCSRGNIGSWINQRNNRRKTEADFEQERHWNEAAPRMYLERRRGEKPSQFHQRLVTEHGCTLSFTNVTHILRRADVLKPRKRSNRAAAAGLQP